MTAARRVGSATSRPRAVLAAWVVACAAVALPARAQNNIALSVSVCSPATCTGKDTLAVVADLGAGTTTFYQALTVSISNCTRSTRTRCDAYMAAQAASGSGTVGSLTFSTTSSTCVGGSAVAAGSSASSSSSRVLRVSEPASGDPATSGSVTVYLCYTVSLAWGTAPQLFRYNFAFRAERT